MRAARTALLTTVLAAAVAVPAVTTACDKPTKFMPRSVAAERREAARREADASRVAEWLTRRILDDFAETDDPVLDISAEEVRAATGVDATTLDLDRVRERVFHKLRDLAIGPSGPESVQPEAAQESALPALPAQPAVPSQARGGGASAGLHATESAPCSSSSTVKQ